MNTKLKLSLLKQLSLRTSHRGFTLIELLVVVIIIGVLAAITLPNLLAQVGKARESEAKNTVGAVNRAQQAYYTEHSAFATTKPLLEMPLADGKYYVFTLGTGNDQGKIIAVDANRQKNGTRDYAGGTAYNSADRDFSTVVCRMNKDVAATFAAVISGTNGVFTTAGEIIYCNTSVSKPVK